MTEEIYPQDMLLRRVANAPAMWTRDESGTIRPSSAAMKPHDADAGLSVDVRRLLEDPSTPLSVLVAFPEHGLAEFRARVALELTLAVHHAPLEENPAHANVTGFEELPKAQAKRVQRELAKAAVWISMPAGALAV